MLASQRKLETRDFLFRLLTSVIGFSVINAHTWCRYIKSNSDKKDHKKIELHTITTCEDYEIQIRKFSENLCVSLEN